jgi:transcriptional adapter 2-alpha
MSRTKRINCAYCHKDVTFNLKIHCNECHDLSLCSDCFAVGVNIDSHVSSHSYRVGDCLDCSIFAKDWSVAEELLLLEGNKNILKCVL